MRCAWELGPDGGRVVPEGAWALVPEEGVV